MDHLFLDGGTTVLQMQQLQWWVYIIIGVSLFAVALVLNCILKKFNDARLDQRLHRVSQKATTSQSTQIQNPTKSANPPREVAKPIAPATVVDTTEVVKATVKPSIKPLAAIIDNEKNYQIIRLKDDPPSVTVANTISSAHAEQHSSPGAAEVPAVSDTGKEEEIKPPGFLGSIYKNVISAKDSTEKSSQKIMTIVSQTTTKQESKDDVIKNNASLINNRVSLPLHASNTDTKEPYQNNCILCLDVPAITYKDPTKLEGTTSGNHPDNAGPNRRPSAHSERIIACINASREPSTIKDDKDYIEAKVSQKAKDSIEKRDSKEVKVTTEAANSNEKGLEKVKVSDEATDSVVKDSKEKKDAKDVKDSKEGKKTFKAKESVEIKDSAELIDSTKTETICPVTFTKSEILFPADISNDTIDEDSNMILVSLLPKNIATVTNTTSDRLGEHIPKESPKIQDHVPSDEESVLLKVASNTTPNVLDPSAANTTKK